MSERWLESTAVLAIGLYGTLQKQMALHMHRSPAAKQKLGTTNAHLLIMHVVGIIQSNAFRCCACTGSNHESPLSWPSICSTDGSVNTLMHFIALTADNSFALCACCTGAATGAQLCRAK